MERVKRTKTPEQALSALMDMCAKAEKSTGDAFRLLYRWGVEKDEHRAVVDRLVAEKYIDDRRYAAAYVRDKMRFSNWGMLKIRAGLRSKRIEEAVIADVLDGLGDADMAGKLASKLEAKFKSIRSYKNKFDLKNKLLRYGMGLGFGYGIVSDAVERIIRDIEDIEEDF